jgi:uncharacterized phosphosugar-binding protein
MGAGKYVAAYRQIVDGLFERIVDEEFGALEKAAELMIETIEKNKLIHVSGTGGHSFMAAEEMFCRAGGLVPVNPIFEQGLTIVNGALRSIMIERIPDYMHHVLEYYGVGQGDVIIVVNAYGINSATIDTALEGHRRGAKVIAVSSSEFSLRIPKDHPARHPSKKNLHELSEVDVHIDCKMPYGDASVAFEEMEQKVGPVSTLVNMFVLNELVITSVAGMVERGIKAPVWTSANIPGGDEKNQEYIDAYFDRIKHL